MRYNGMKVLYRDLNVSALHMGLMPKRQPLESHSCDDPQVDPFGYYYQCERDQEREQKTQKTNSNVRISEGIEEKRMVE
ncbi:MAG: hypothetical protein AYK19_12140 [Theionarchaea archaeon DG-70-1]|nr:MAG: hypothetical protein AYK19_12140 [Theionarchaea archaeon DG-70-1]